MVIRYIYFPMKHILFFVLVCTTFTSFAQKEVRTYYDNSDVLKEVYFVNQDNTDILEGKYIMYHPNQVIATEGAFEGGYKNGIFRQYYSNGEVQRIVEYKNGLRDGQVKVFNTKGSIIQSAVYTKGELSDSLYFYYDNGRVKSKGKFIDGKPDGQLIDYYENGNIKRNISYAQGEQNGKSTTYFEDGNLRTEGNYKKGRLDGNYTTYYPSGQIETTSEMLAGAKSGVFKNYDEQGQLLLIGHYQNGRLHGENIAYYPNGNIRHKYLYQDGLLIGINDAYYPNGKIKSKTTVSKDLVNKEVVLYDSTGQKSTVELYVTNKKNGNWLEYYPGTEQVKRRTPYDMGRINGKRISYHLNGNVAKEEIFKFDNLYETAKTYYESGTLKETIPYHSDKMHGIYEDRYENGQTKVKGEYVGNRKVMEWNYYTEDGTLEKIEIYQAGKLSKVVNQ